MTAADVYEKIVSGQHFEFQSQDPLGIVRNALSRHSVENQLLADVVGHLNDHSHWICHAGFLHPLHHIRAVVV